MMTGKRITNGLMVAVVAMGMMVGAASADVIFVVDAPDSTAARAMYPIPVYGGATQNVTFDLSTGGDSAAGLAGSLTTTSSSGWHETGSITTHFNDDYMGLMNGAGDTATWTVTGYTPGQSVEVYAHWAWRAAPTRRALTM